MTKLTNWRVPDCAWCNKPIEGEDAESGKFAQLFGDEGDYYFHYPCYRAYENRKRRPDPTGQGVQDSEAEEGKQ